MSAVTGQVSGDRFSPEEIAKLKREQIKIEPLLKSELPYRVSIKRSGVVLGSFETQIAADEFVLNLPIRYLKLK